ncbi:MAG: FAD-binding protein [Dehalococcoidia bacterium]|nr:FAD-binding protein [Dehalococcoidia bacterium]
MKIAVCIKQVPVVSMIKFDNETRRVVREGVPNEVNPYDVLSLSLAVRLKGEHGTEVVALTMGPPQASDALVQALAMGADRAVHLNDRAFAGSDTLATSRALALALEREQPDLVICGRNSTDAETGQVGPEIAEILGVPQITAVSKLDMNPEAGTISATRLTDEGYQELECPMPALVTITDGAAEEVYPRREAMAEAASRPIEQLTAADLTDDMSQFGLDGSPTWVDEIFSLESTRLGTVVRDLPPAEAVAQMMEFLEERGVFGPSTSSGQAPSTGSGRTGVARGPRLEQGPSTSSGRTEGAIWVVAEVIGGEVRPVTLELLGRARELAAQIGTTVEAVLIGDDDDGRIRQLTAYGADTVHIAGGSGQATYDTEAHTAALTAAIKAQSPFAVLVPSTANGRDLAARVAGRLELGLTGDCVGLDIDDEGRLSQLKPAFGGSIVAPILSRTLPNMATVRPGILTACDPDESVEPVVNRIDVGTVEASGVRVLRSVSDESAEGAELERAARVVSVGMGIGGPENLGPIRELASALGASIGTTRDVCDLGWLPRQYQLGLSGKAVAPELYVAVALRGPFNHTVGIQRSGTIVAINNSARSQIFRASDFGILGDWNEIVPELTTAIRQRLGV